MSAEAARIGAYNRALFDAYQQGRYEEALEYALAAMRLASEYYGDVSSQYGILANNTAMLLRRLGRLNEAESFSRLALAVSETALGVRHPEYATNLNNLGLLLIDLGRYEEAEVRLRQAIELRKEILGDRSVEYATSLNNIAMLYRETGRYEEGVSHFTLSCEIRQAHFSSESIELAESFNNIGTMYHSLGRFQEAERYLHRAVESYQNLLGDEHPDTVNAMSNLGMLFRAAGKHIEAESLLRTVMEYRSTLSSTHPDYALSLGNLAGLYLELGRTDRAIALYLEVLKVTREVFGEQNPKYAAGLDNLALAYCEMGEYATAEPLYREALRLQEEILGKGHPDYALSMNNLGHALYYMHRYEEAIALLVQARKIQRKCLDVGHPDLAYTDNNLASAYLAMRDFDKARKLYRSRVRSTRKSVGELHIDYARVLNNLAFLDTAEKRYHSAFLRWKQVVTIENHLLAGILTLSSEVQRLQYTRKLQTTYHAVLALTIRYLSNRKSAVQFAFEILLQRKALSIEASMALRFAVLSGRYPHLQPDLQRLLTLKQQLPQALGTLDRRDLSAAEYRSWQSSLERWQQEHDALESSLARQVPEVGLRASLSSARWRAVAAQLPPKTCLVEFVRYYPNDFYALPAAEQGSRWGKARFAAFVLSAMPGAKVSVVDLGDADHIQELATAYIENISDARAAQRSSSNQNLDQNIEASQSALDRANSQLSATVWHPLIPLLNKAERIILCPDGALHLIPFEALLWPDGGSVGERKRISYLNSGRELLHLSMPETNTVPAAPCLVVSPDYDLSLEGVASNGLDPVEQLNVINNSHDDTYPALASSLVESAVLARYFAVPPIAHQQATERRVKAACRNSVILHFSTHGEYMNELEDESDDDNSKDRSRRNLKSPLLRSWLVLAGANSWTMRRPVPEEVEDGRLTAEDVSGMDLMGTELVVLSACRSGLGGIITGEGVFGLRRAFIQSGAKTLIVSLWSVEGLSTAWLIEHFYRQLFQHGQSRDQALRVAQQATRDAQAIEVLRWLEELGPFRVQAKERLLEARIKQWKAQLQRTVPSHRPFAHSYYWSGFICIGKTEPLSEAHILLARGPLNRDGPHAKT